VARAPSPARSCGIGASQSQETAIHDDFITLARVLKTQGRHGEIAVELHTSHPDRFSPGMHLFALAPDNTRREVELLGEISRENAQIRDAVLTDPVKPFSNGEYDAAVATLHEFAQRRGGFVTQSVNSAR
jgi:hypothetical protein